MNKKTIMFVFSCAMVLFFQTAWADEAYKTEINKALASYMGQQKDFIDDRSQLDEVIAKLALDGWQFNEDEQGCSFYRGIQIRITRTPEHQAIVEAKGQVEKGENTYLSNQNITTRCLDVEGEVLDKNTKVGRAAAEAFSFGPRPSNWVKDL